MRKLSFIFMYLFQLKLVNPSPSRLEHLVTQMKWRLQEGQGEAIYEIGVEDNGMMVGLSKEELDSSLSTLNIMASRLGAHTTMLRHRLVDGRDANQSKQVAEVLVRRVAADQQVSLCSWYHLNFPISGKNCYKPYAKIAVVLIFFCLYWN